ncbi:DUF1656 domain-containing protein [Sphingomonas sp. CCH5-D11]|uniref:DUF1656 domain-containing protein n=1 Tax=Sphingomonas sp. CCH5-D11 TaxID=1768786 RepID=UPI00082F36B1|nr:DUF1656 domain-containing protein [Sphingomonas sp. CCH5-D11]
MIEEVHFGGIYVPTALVTAVISVVLVYFLRMPMQRLPLHRFIWQPALLDLAAFTLIWWGLSAAADFIPHFRLHY